MGRADKINLVVQRIHSWGPLTSLSQTEAAVLSFHHHNSPQPNMETAAELGQKSPWTNTIPYLPKPKDNDISTCIPKILRVPLPVIDINLC